GTGQCSQAAAPQEIQAPPKSHQSNTTRSSPPPAIQFRSHSSSTAIAPHAPSRRAIPTAQAPDRAAPKSALHPIQIPLEFAARQTRSTQRYFHFAPPFEVPSRAAANASPAPETADAAQAQ